MATLHALCCHLISMTPKYGNTACIVLSSHLHDSQIWQHCMHCAVISSSWNQCCTLTFPYQTKCSLCIFSALFSFRQNIMRGAVSSLLTVCAGAVWGREAGKTGTLHDKQFLLTFPAHYFTESFSTT